MVKIDVKEHKKVILELCLIEEDKKKLKRLIKLYSNATERIQEHNKLIDELRVTSVRGLFGEDLKAPILERINKLKKI